MRLVYPSLPRDDPPVFGVTPFHSTIPFSEGEKYKYFTGRCPHTIILFFSYLLLPFSIMAEPNGALEKSTLHQFENGADLRQHKEIADAEASSLGSPTFEGVEENA